MLLTKVDHSNPRLTPNGKFNIMDELDFTRIKIESVAKNIEYFEYQEEKDEFILPDLDENGVNNINLIIL